MADTAQDLLRHVVLFKFKEDASEAEIRAVEQAFSALPAQIDVIYAFEWGTDVSVEHISRGYTHCFTLTFLSETARDAYLPHPAHKAFGQMLRPILESVLVVDYWAKR